ncbi:MAG: hypothetical protein H8E57_05175 [Candidatus Cloacimonetes bacterium]|nr:hypothetical protein [Candidatus Cloacimonadota bacterium]
MDLITKRTKLKEVFSGQEEKLKALSEKYDIKEEELEYISKGFSDTSKIEVNDNERSVIKYVSSISVDRDDDIILPKGVKLDDFKKNPVVLYGHQSGGTGWVGAGHPVLPIGKDLWIKADKKGILAKQTYANHQLADDVYNMHKDGFPLASSIGFIPLKRVSKRDKELWDFTVNNAIKEYGLDKKFFKNAERIYTEVLLLEHSDVSVPSNPDALALSYQKGIIKIKSPELLEDLELTHKNSTNPPEYDIQKGINIIIENQKSIEERIEELEKRITPEEPVAPINPIEEAKTLTSEYVEQKIKENTKNILDEIKKMMGKI